MTLKKTVEFLFLGGVLAVVVAFVLPIVFSENKPPVVGLSSGPTSGPAPFGVSFDASASYDPENSDLKYQWKIDGKLKSEESGFKYTFLEPNRQFKITLTVTDNKGISRSKSVFVTTTNNATYTSTVPKVESQPTAPTLNSAQSKTPDNISTPKNEELQITIVSVKVKNDGTDWSTKWAFRLFVDNRMELESTPVNLDDSKSEPYDVNESTTISVANGKPIQIRVDALRPKGDHKGMAISGVTKTVTPDLKSHVSRNVSIPISGTLEKNGKKLTASFVASVQFTPKTIGANN